MTHQAPPSLAVAGPDPGRQVARLREALRLIERIAGRSASPAHDDALDEAARISAAYDAALPVVQRRFESLAAETAIWAAAGVEALLAAGEAEPPRAAAARLAGQLDAALSAMAALLR
ncbi:MAG TPA: hypothetical protein VES64_06945 [Allosphingosinicella sp.]|nr:hypothetical protein [Allosphingosinicella sp.]